MKLKWEKKQQVLDRFLLVSCEASVAPWEPGRVWAPFWVAFGCLPPAADGLGLPRPHDFPRLSKEARPRPPG